jgi:hypothetical protein
MQNRTISRTSSRLEVLEIVLFCMLALLASQVVSGFANADDVVKRRRPVLVPIGHEKRKSWSGTFSRLRAKIALF